MIAEYKSGKVHEPCIQPMDAPYFPKSNVRDALPQTGVSLEIPTQCKEEPCITIVMKTSSNNFALPFKSPPPPPAPATNMNDECLAQVHLPGLDFRDNLILREVSQLLLGLSRGRIEERRVAHLHVASR